MFASYFQRLFADLNGTPALIRRLLVEQAAGQWRRYAFAFGLMGIAAASTAFGAYLVGDVINQAYVHKNLPGIIILALVTAVIFMIKAMATYGQAVFLARIRNAIGPAAGSFLSFSAQIFEMATFEPLKKALDPERPLEKRSGHARLRIVAAQIDL
jgi:ABC-type multidrug transport system fused ATPase/permease subunit